MVAGKADQGAAPCGSAPSFSPPRSCWRRSAARAADLVVWWEEGWYPEEDRAVAELVAAFEAKTGRDVELVRQPHDARAEVTAALEAGRPPDFLWGLGGTAGLVGRWALEGRLADLTEAVGPLREMFDADALEHATLPNARTGGRALYALPMGRSSNHVHVWTGLLERAGFTLADIPTEWGAFWSFWCDKVQPAVRKALGRDDVWGVALPMSREAGDTSTGLEQFAWALTPHRPLPAGWSLADAPAARAILSRRSGPTRRSTRRAARRPTRWAGPTATTTRPSSSGGSSW